MLVDPRSVQKLAIIGGPRTGKTTYSLSLGRPDLYHTDEFVDRPWGDHPSIWLERLGDEPSWVLEGVHTARIVRAGLRPDFMLFCDRPFVGRSTGQEAMAKGILKIFNHLPRDIPHLRLHQLEGV